MNLLPSLPLRFYSKVKATEGCWPWLAAKRHGYGAYSTVKPKVDNAHRVIYEAYVGPIPIGLQIDHLCRNKSCVNPKHLEAVTRLENLRRGNGRQATLIRHAQVTHCPKGHEYTQDNIYWYKQKGYLLRDCRECSRERWRIAYRRKHDIVA